MKSLRQLSNELRGVRLNAANIAQWNVVEAVSEYARVALNDAVNTFPLRVEMIYTSGVLQDDVIVLPRRTDNVIHVELCGTTSTPRREVKHWKLYATPSTTFLRVYGEADGRLDVTYNYRQPPLPADIALTADNVTSINVSGAAPAHTWPQPPAYVELYQETGGYDTREVVMYTALTPGGFSGVVRSVEGATQTWPSGTIVSACWAAPEEDLRPTMLMAQAVMYEFFLRHRALYDQYTALASMQAFTLEELQILIRDLEARARLDYDSRKRLPAPSGAKLRRGTPT